MIVCGFEMQTSRNLVVFSLALLESCNHGVKKPYQPPSETEATWRQWLSQQPAPTAKHGNEAVLDDPGSCAFCSSPFWTSVYYAQSVTLSVGMLAAWVADNLSFQFVNLCIKSDHTLGVVLKETQRQPDLRKLTKLWTSSLMLPWYEIVGGLEKG